ncbi:MAG: MFS transporter [Phaeodactylibacter sp.]|nr:MFS transporter [Phaeodactylibacter sp.]
MEQDYDFRKVFAAACLGMLLFGIVMISLGSMMPSIIEKYGLDTLQAGSLASILPAGILLGSLAFGPVVDRYSYRNLMVICTLLIVAGLESIALAEGLPALQAGFFLIGCGGGALNGGTNALVADISEDRAGKRSANLSLLGVFFGIGALGMPSLMAMLSAIWPFERILAFTGVAVIIPLAYFLLVRYPAPRHGQAIPLSASFAMARNAPLIMLGLFLFFQSALEGVINNWTATFLQNEKSVGAKEALVALSIFVASLTVARALLAVVLRKIPPFHVLLASIGLLFAGTGLLLAGVASPILYFGGLTLLGTGAAAGFPVILGYVSELYTSLRGTAFSLVFFIALMGNIVVNYLMGVIAHRYGMGAYPWILLLCAICLLVIAAAAVSRVAGGSVKTMDS